MKHTFLTALLLAASSTTVAEDFSAIFGIVPGEPVPYLQDGFGPSPNNTYEKPIRGEKLGHYFQHIQVMVLPPETVAHFYGTRAYRGALQCMEDMASIKEILLPLFPNPEDENEYQRLTVDGEIRLSLGCRTTGRIPYYSLRMHVSHIEAASKLREQIFGPDR